jgi:hypothetical protein
MRGGASRAARSFLGGMIARRTASAPPHRPPGQARALQKRLRRQRSAIPHAPRLAPRIARPPLQKGPASLLRPCNFSAHPVRPIRNQWKNTAFIGGAANSRFQRPAQWRRLPVSDDGTVTSLGNSYRNALVNCGLWVGLQSRIFDELWSFLDGFDFAYRLRSATQRPTVGRGARR